MTKDEDIIDKYKKIYGVELDFELMNRLLLDKMLMEIPEKTEEKDHPQPDAAGD